MSMEEAFAKAGKMSPQKRLEKFAEIAIKADSFEAARGAFLEALMNDAGAMKALMGDALTKRAGDYLHEAWNKRNSRKAGQLVVETQIEAAAPSANGGGGQLQHETQTRVASAAISPGRREAAKGRMKSIFDTFAIIDRNGERLPIGDIQISSYERLIAMTNKRSWRANREHALLRLLKVETDRRAVHYPEGATTRDIFEAKEIEAFIETATKFVLPPIDASSFEDHPNA